MRAFQTQATGLKKLFAPKPVHTKNRTVGYTLSESHLNQVIPLGFTRHEVAIGLDASGNFSDDIFLHLIIVINEKVGAKYKVEIAKDT